MLPTEQVLTELIANAYDAAGETGQWEGFLQNLAHTTGADSAALVIHEVSDQLRVVAASWMVDPEASRLYQEHYGSVDVWAERGKPKPAGFVCTSDSLCSLQEMAATEIYNDFMVRNRIAHGLFGVVENDSSRCWGSVSLYREYESGEFQDAQLETLRVLIPHVRRSFKLHSRFAELNARTAAAERSLNLLPIGIILLGVNGELVLANRRAEEVLRAGDGLVTVRGRFCATTRHESSRLRGIVTAAVQTGSGRGLSAGGTIPISRTKGRPLIVTVSPLRSTTGGFGKRPCAVVFISDPDLNVNPPVEILQQCFGLTPAESRLAMVVIEGRSLKEAADLCGVTENTAKSQLKSIYSKTQVRRQSELVRVLLNGTSYV